MVRQRRPARPVSGGRLREEARTDLRGLRAGDRVEPGALRRVVLELDPRGCDGGADHLEKRRIDVRVFEPRARASAGEPTIVREEAVDYAVAIPAPEAACGRAREPPASACAEAPLWFVQT